MTPLVAGLHALKFGFIAGIPPLILTAGSRDHPFVGFADQQTLFTMRIKRASSEAVYRLEEIGCLQWRVDGYLRSAPIGILLRVRVPPALHQEIG